jgi:hypothetical protein
MTKPRSILRVALLPLATVACTAALVIACSSSSSSPSNPLANLQFDNSAAVPGVDDTHCLGDGGGTTHQAINASSCHSQNPSGGASSLDAGGAGAYGPTHYNTQGYDDDCKYSVRWQSTSTLVRKDVYFQVQVNALTDNTALTGDKPKITAQLTDVHAALPTTQSATETTPGTYVIGPMQFDAPGNWTVRFNFHPECDNGTPDSPRGFAAFYVAVTEAPSTSSSSTPAPAGDQ